MAKSAKSIATDVAKAAFFATVPGASLVSAIVDATKDSVFKSQAVAESGKLEELRAETERQELASRMAEDQARVAQELAIARRIETAQEVEISEFYDYSGKGHVGGEFDGHNITLGIGGSGRRVRKRVYRFKGRLDVETEANVEVDGPEPDERTA